MDADDIDKSKYKCPPREWHISRVVCLPVSSNIVQSLTPNGSMWCEVSELGVDGKYPAICSFGNCLDRVIKLKQYQVTKDPRSSEGCANSALRLLLSSTISKWYHALPNTSCHLGLYRDRLVHVNDLNLHKLPARYVTWSRGMSWMSEILFLWYWQRKRSNSFVLYCFQYWQIAHNFVTRYPILMGFASKCSNI